MEKNKSDSVCDRNPVEQLAADFAERIRNGERASVEEYAGRHPKWANEIRDLFPTVLAMERLNSKRMMGRHTQKNKMPEQLGDYRIIAEIARGGMGIVYEAEQVSLGRHVAVKVLPPRALHRDKDLVRFEREALTAANLHHSNIVPVFGVGEDQGQRYIVMQFIRGAGLDEILGELKRIVSSGQNDDATGCPSSRVSIVKRSAADLLNSELRLDSTKAEAHADTVKMTPEPITRRKPSHRKSLGIQGLVDAAYYKNVAQIGLQAARALDHAHQHDTLHRDIKPGNLLLDESGRVWIADFGLAKAMQDESVTASDDIVGTIAYVAPERFRGETTELSDVYSLGVTLHEMLTLQQAFAGDDRVAVMSQVANEGLPKLRQLNREIPADLETIVYKAASRDPKDRYESAGHLASDLQAFLEDRPIQARRLSRVEYGMRWCRRNRGMAGLATTVLVLLATVFALLLFGYGHSQRQRHRAEATSRLAIGALDEIYNRFASAPLTATLIEEGEETAAEGPQMPISKDVALLLNNLLGFYDELSQSTDDSEAVAIKYIAANRRVGDINRRLGQRVAARSSYEEAIERIGQLSPTVRETEALRLETARAHNGLGLSYPFWACEERAQSHQDAVFVLEHPGAADSEQFELATSLFLLHSAERHRRNRRKSGHHPEHEGGDKTSSLERAKEIVEQLKQRNSNHPEYELLLARCLLVKRGTNGGVAEDDQHRAIQILEELVEAHPENPDYRFEVGRVYRAIGCVDRNWRHSSRESTSSSALTEAERRLRRGLDATASLEIQHPNIPQYYQLKKELHENLGKILWRQDKLSSAQGEYVRAIQMQKLLVARDENPQMHRPWLYSLQAEYGKLLRDAGNFRRAKKILLATAVNLETLLEPKETGRNHRFQRYGDDRNKRTLTSTYLVLATVCKGLGEEDEEKEMLRKAETLGG